MKWVTNQLNQQDTMSQTSENNINISQGILNGQSGSYLEGRLIIQSNGVVRLKTTYVKRKRKRL